MINYKAFGKYSTKNENKVFNGSRYSKIQYEARSDQSGNVGRQVVSLANRIAHKVQDCDKDANQFGSELFSRLYEDSERIEDAECSWESVAHDTIDQLPEFEELRFLTEDDPDMAALGTATFLGSIKKEVKEMIEDIEQLDPDVRIGPTTPGNILDKYRGKIRVGIQKAIDETNDISEAINWIGCGKNGDATRSALIDSLMYNPSLKEIMKKAGKILSVMQGIPTKSRNSNEEIQGIEYGRDLRRLTNQSIGYLSHPSTEDLFYGKWASRELELLSMEGKEKLGRGDVFLLVDHSESMGWATSAQCAQPRNLFARAASLAIFKMAMDEKRKFEMLDFNHMVTEEYRSFNGDYSIGGSTTSKTSMIETIGTRGPIGGTNFDRAIPFAIDAISKNADLIFITDAEDTISNVTRNQIVKAKKDGLRIFTIAIGAQVVWLEELSDIYIDIAQVSSEDIEKAIGGIVKEAKTS